MPIGKRPALSQSAVSTGMGQPMVIAYTVRCQHCTAWYFFKPVEVNRAPAGIFIHESANKIRVVHLTRIFIFKLVQAALSAAIAQRFPFLLRHLIQAFALPERDLRNHECFIPSLVRKSTT